MYNISMNLSFLITTFKLTTRSHPRSSHLDLLSSYPDEQGTRWRLVLTLSFSVSGRLAKARTQGLQEKISDIWLEAGRELGLLGESHVCPQLLYNDVS